MKCAACYYEMVKKTGEIDLRVNGKLYIVRNISYYECPSCGEKTLPAETSQHLFEDIRNRKFTEKAITVPVLDGTYG